MARPIRITELELLLGGAFRALRIHDRSSFSWFGYRDSIPRSRARSLPRDELLAYARRRICQRLYESFYARGAALPVVQSEEPSAWERDLFVRTLTRANSGRYVDEPGWKIIAEGVRDFVVSKHGLSVRVRRDSVKRIVGDRGVIRYSAELLNSSPGFYTVLGDKQFTTQAVVRIYWHLTVDGAVAFVRGVTRLMNDAGLPFRAKVLSSPQSFCRADAAVIYMPRSIIFEAYPVVRALYRRLFRHLRSLTPVFTKRIGDGVAIAEEPQGGGSFGQHRCDIVAKALLSAYRCGAFSVDDQLYHVRCGFKRAGLSLSQPFLNGGSTDRYPLLT